MARPASYPEPKYKDGLHYFVLPFKHDFSALGAYEDIIQYFTYKTFIVSKSQQTVDARIIVEIYDCLTPDNVVIHSWAHRIKTTTGEQIPLHWDIGLFSNNNSVDAVKKSLADIIEKHVTLE